MVKEDFVQFLKGRVIFVGIGNSLRGDDGFGPALINELQGQIKAVCLDAGPAPENYTGKIIKESPDTIVLVDAVHLDLPPGECAFLCKSDILKTGFTTHDLSPTMLIQYLESQTQADIYLLGMQPKTMSLGAPMSDIVSNSIKRISEMIKEAVDA